MSSLFTTIPFDFEALPLYNTFKYQTSVSISKNQKQDTPNGVVYSDVLTYNWIKDGVNYTTSFFGSGLEKPTGFYNGLGVVNTIAFNVADVIITFFSVPMSDFLMAGSTSQTSDDIALYSRIFSGNDGLPGSVFDDKLLGFSGNDIFVPIGGNDYVDGGLGFDIVAYTDSPTNPTGYQRAEFKIIKSGDTILVSDTIAGRFGSDTLASVEKLVFQDLSVQFDTEGNPGGAYRIYEAAFNRKPDVGGLGYWIAQLDKGLSLKTVAELFLSSAEFKALYGSSPSSAAFVDSLYKNILDRAGEKGGVDYWNGVLNNGISRADVLVSFSESAENKAGVIGSIQNGIEYKEWFG